MTNLKFLRIFLVTKDWLSDSWRLMASILGVISMALCIVLVTEFGKLKYRKLIKGVSLSRHPTGKGVT
uniref:Uncharacterized protein n=1 Tax=Magallana gigas TaxID=29159 RepID=K1QPC5_MAGGI